MHARTLHLCASGSPVALISSGVDSVARPLEVGTHFLELEASHLRAFLLTSTILSPNEALISVLGDPRQAKS